MRQKPIVTIDGPSGAGKSTVAKRLAETLGYAYIDTGAMYRGVAVACQKYHIEEPTEHFLSGLDLSFDFQDHTVVILDGSDISEAIRVPRISGLASNLSQKGVVRAYLTAKQRETGQKGGVVLEGRDTGSVVFPDAEVKFYLDADLSERAQRRAKELEDRGTPQGVEQVKDDMAIRDENDSKRDIAPLVRPEGSIPVDTTGLSVEQVVTIMLDYVRKGEQGWKS